MLRSVRPTCGSRASVQKRAVALSRPIGKRSGLNGDPCGGIYKLLAASAAAAEGPNISRRGPKALAAVRRLLRRRLLETSARCVRGTNSAIAQGTSPTPRRYVSYGLEWRWLE